MKAGLAKFQTKAHETFCGHKSETIRKKVTRSKGKESAGKKVLTRTEKAPRVFSNYVKGATGWVWAIRRRKEMPWLGENCIKNVPVGGSMFSCTVNK